MIKDKFVKLRMAYQAQPFIPLKTRINTLKKIEKIIIDNERGICDRISEDFGFRSVYETRMLETSPIILGLRYTRSRLKKWMRPQKRHVSLIFFGAGNRVIPQAKGIVGIVAPWNYPLFLSLGPLTSAIAAGNRVMLKLATRSQGLCYLLKKKFSEQISEDLISFHPGVTASDFTSVPYDHLVFTGSSHVGQQVMKKASRFLTPVTLELGGKSPTILMDDFDLTTAVKRIMFGKLINAGQTCISPDYLFVPEKKVDAFIEAAKEIACKYYPTLESNDYTAIIDEKAYLRLTETLADAQKRGAEAIPLVPDAGSRLGPFLKLAPAIVKGVTEEMIIMQEEIFGPFLPVMPYSNIDEVIKYINSHERPLALYMFTNDKKAQEHILTNTISGSVCINDCIFQIAQHDMPFGGIGNSGMGQYHGYEGFIEFSKLKPVFKQAPKTLSLAPPYGRFIDRLLSVLKKVKKLR